MERRILLSIALGTILAIVGPIDVSVAGEKDYKCQFDTQTCLDKMVTKMTTRGWLGIEYDNSLGDDHLKITRVVPGSPAESAGFLTDDVLVSIDGARFAENTEDKCVTCEKMKGAWKPGAQIEYVVRRDGEEVLLSATLAPLPSDVLAMMIGMHMLEHARP